MLLLLTLAHANPTTLTGDRPASDLLQAVGRQPLPLSACFEGDKTAQVELDVVVLPSGDVRKVKPRSGPEPIGACVAGHVGSLTLPPHDGKAKLRWQVGLNDLVPRLVVLDDDAVDAMRQAAPIQVGAASGPAPNTGVGRLIGAKGTQIGSIGLVSGVSNPDAPVILGALSRSHMDQVIRAASDDVQACFQAALPEHPDRTGRVVVKFTVSPEGAVTQAVTKHTTLDLPEVEDCVLDHVRALAFDPPKGGGIVIASPFRFPAE